MICRSIETDAARYRAHSFFDEMRILYSHYIFIGPRTRDKERAVGNEKERERPNCPRKSCTLANWEILNAGLCHVRTMLPSWVLILANALRPIWVSVQYVSSGRVKVSTCELCKVDCALISGMAVIKYVMHAAELCATSAARVCDIDFNRWREYRRSIIKTQLRRRACEVARSPRFTWRDRAEKQGQTTFFSSPFFLYSFFFLPLPPGKRRSPRRAEWKFSPSSRR